jgi:hypothetical protein
VELIEGGGRTLWPRPSRTLHTAGEARCGPR